MQRRLVLFLCFLAAALPARAEVTRMTFSSVDGTLFAFICEIDPPDFHETCFQSPYANQGGWAVESTTRPPGTSIQRMMALVNFGDFFDVTTGHVAFALNAYSDYTTQAYGRGVIVGARQGGPTACPDDPMIQVEAFGLTSNVLYRETCNPWPIAGWGDYLLVVESDFDTGVVAFLITDAFGNPLHTWLSQADTSVLCPAVPDPDLPCDVPPATGWWVAHVGGNVPGASWEIEIKAIFVDWH